MIPYSDAVDLRAITRSALVRYGFAPEFTKPALDEARTAYKKAPPDRKGNGIRDMRDVLWSSIDNVDSLDLDQVEFCERGLRQEILVKVAIADVDLFVPRGGAVDRFASDHGNSVYTGAENFPMLPNELSTDLTSLKPGEDRFAIVIEFAVLKNGAIRQGDIYRARVRNKAKLVYEEVGAWLEDRGAPPRIFESVPGLEEQVRLQDEAATRLKNFRMEQGALDFESLELKAIKENGVVIALILPQENKAQYIIENFMIAANRTVMDFLGKAMMPVVQRVVRVPKNWPGIVEVAMELGERLPMEPDALPLSKFLLKRKAKDPDRFADLSLTIVKLLGPGEYTMLEPGKPPVGHFGLAVMDYTHATAPNRRYVDLIIQRLLKAAMDRRNSPYTRKELIEHAAWCTDRDKSAKKVERFMQKVEAAILMQDRVGEVFDGIVTGASPKGVYVRLMNPPVEGRVVRGGEGMSVGQKVRVKLTSLDPAEGHIDLMKVRR